MTFLASHSTKLQKNCMKKKQLIAYLLILLVNLLFGLKYFNRYTGQGVLLSLLMLGFQIFIIYFFSKKISFSKKGIIPKAFGAITILFIGVLIFSHFYIDVTALRVDKWSILQAFYEELFKGNYPYFARSNIDNPVAPMPFYFVIFYPFYWIGEVGILCTLGYITFMGILQKQNKSAINTKIILLILLSTSLFTYWEITARSNIFFNSILILIALKYYSSIDKKSISKTFIISAALTGLVLSTRSIFIVIYATTFLSSLFRKEISTKHLISYGLIAVSTFGLTFLPLLAFYWDEFWIMNPFMVQSGVVVPTSYVTGFFLLGIFFSFLIKKKEDQYFYGGVILFIIVTITFVFNSQNISLRQALLVEGADISYFIFPIPFLMLYILQTSPKPNQPQTALPTD